MVVGTMVGVCRKSLCEGLTFTGACAIMWVSPRGAGLERSCYEDGLRVGRLVKSTLTYKLP